MRTLQHKTAQAEGAHVVLDLDQLKAVQRQAIQLLASGLRVTEVARRLDIGRRTVHAWLSDDEAFGEAFSAEVARREHSIRTTATSSYQAALDMCRTILEHGKTHEKLLAAGLILRHTAPIAVRDAMPPPATSERETQVVADGTPERVNGTGFGGARQAALNAAAAV